MYGLYTEVEWVRDLACVVKEWWCGYTGSATFYVTNYTPLYHHIVVLDRYTNSNLVYYKHNGDDEPSDCCPCKNIDNTDQNRLDVL